MARKTEFVGFDGKNKCLREFSAIVAAAQRERTWVGLTDEEYQTTLKQHNGAGLLAFYNLIEAALKKKNT